MKDSIPHYIDLHQSLKYAILKSLGQFDAVPLSFHDVDFFKALFSSEAIPTDDINHAVTALVREGSILAYESAETVLLLGGEKTDHVRAPQNDDENLDLDEILTLRITDLGVQSLTATSKLKNPSIKKMREANDFELAVHIEEMYENLPAIGGLRYEPDQEFQQLALSEAEAVQAAASVELLLRLIRTSNQAMANATPDLEKSLRNLEDGLAELKSGRSTINKIESFFYGSLAFIATSFADAPIGEAAEFAWSSIKMMVMSSL